LSEPFSRRTTRRVAALLLAAVFCLCCLAIAWHGVRADTLWRRPLVKFAGLVTDTSSEQWRIGDQSVLVNPSTAPLGSFQEGRSAVVVAAKDEEGRLYARTLTSPPGAGVYGTTFEFRCLIQELELRYWIVCNRVVLVTESTVIQGRPEVGYLATVKAIRLTAEGTVLARSIKVDFPGAYAEVEFEGPIETSGPSVWVVNGITVLISPVTVVRGIPQPGLVAEVQGVLQPDDSVLAQSITVKGAGLGSQVDIEGLVDKIEPSAWVVGGQTVVIGGQTFIDESQAPAEVGMWAQVRALRRLDGTLLALRIRLSRPN